MAEVMGKKRDAEDDVRDVEYCKWKIQFTQHRNVVLLVERMGNHGQRQRNAVRTLIASSTLATGEKCVEKGTNKG